MLVGPFCQMIKLPCARVRLDLLVPLIRNKVLKPLRESSQIFS